MHVSGGTTVERIWHIQDSQGQILAWSSRLKSLNPLNWFSLRLQAVARHMNACSAPTMGGPDTLHNKQIHCSEEPRPSNQWCKLARRC